MKNQLASVLLAAILILLVSCYKEYHNQENMPGTVNPPAPAGYSTIGEFIATHEVQSQILEVSGNTGGTLVSAKGTQLHIPPNAFITLTGSPVSGLVKIEFKDLYKKSEMVLSNMLTTALDGRALQSGGEFFMRATSAGAPVQIAPGSAITVELPLGSGGYDDQMMAYIRPNGTTTWITSPTTAQMTFDSTYLSYLMDVFMFDYPEDSGTWYNCDYPAFDGYPETTLTLHSTEDLSGYDPVSFLVFDDLNAAVTLYPDGDDYPYLYAPVGENGHFVSMAVKDKAFYAAIVPFAISPNLTQNFTLAPMTEAEFYQQLEQLD